MVVLVDADDVIENLSVVWVDYLNRRYGTHVTRDDLKEWNVQKAFPSLTREQVYDVANEDEMYYDLKPIDGAAEYLKRMIDDGHDVYIVTNTSYHVVRVKMEQVIFKYFPYITWDKVIVTSNKQMIKGDVLIDDGVHNLIGADYAKILVSAPYNASFDAEKHGMKRVSNWHEIYDAVCELARSEKKS